MKRGPDELHPVHNGIAVNPSTTATPAAAAAAATRESDKKF